MCKKTNIPQDAAWKVLQFTMESLFYTCTFYFENGQNSEALIFDATEKDHFLVHNEFLFLCHQLMNHCF